MSAFQADDTVSRSVWCSNKKEPPLERRLNGSAYSSTVFMQKSRKHMIPAGAVNQIGRAPVIPIKEITLETYTS